MANPEKNETQSSTRDIADAKRTIEQQFDAAGIEIKAAVDRGELTKAEARAEWNYTRREIIQGAVESGLLTEADGSAYRQWINSEALGSELRKAGKRIKSAAERGELSEDEAWAEWYAAKEQKISEALERGEISEADAAGFERDLRQAELKERIEAVGNRTKVAVESGLLSKEDGWKAWGAERENLIADAEARGEISPEDANDFRRGYEEWEVGQRLKEAVADGEMTEADARAAWTEYRDAANDLDEMLASNHLAMHRIVGKSESKTDSLNLRVVLLATRRVKLSRDQRNKIRIIQRRAFGEFGKISRMDKKKQTELARLVKADTLKLLGTQQAEEYEEAIERIQRMRDRSKQRIRPAGGPQG